MCRGTGGPSKSVQVTIKILHSLPWVRGGDESCCLYQRTQPQLKMQFVSAVKRLKISIMCLTPSLDFYKMLYLYIYTGHNKCAYYAL